ncbi:uncharacterized protein LOC144641186 [Oculina patagonica]
MSAEKKSRSSRFTSAMSEALVQAYGQNQAILQAKFFSTVSLEKKKKHAWGVVVDAVNAVNPGEPKNVDQVKKRWEDMTGNVKKKEREMRNKELRRLRVTGNGHLEDVDDETKAKLLKPCTENLNSSQKEIALLLGPQTFTGIPGGFDSLGMSGQTSKEDKASEMLEPDIEEVTPTTNSSCTASVTIEDSKSVKAEHKPFQKGKRPQPKTLSQAQLFFFFFFFFFFVITVI